MTGWYAVVKNQSSITLSLQVWKIIKQYTKIFCGAESKIQLSLWISNDIFSTSLSIENLNSQPSALLNLFSKNCWHDN